MILASDESLIYNWQVPQYVLEAIDNGDSHIYKEDGIPELGLQGEYLITFNEVIGEGQFDGISISVKSMGEEVDALNAFFSDEQNKINLIMGLVLFGSIILVVLITFFILSYLIRKRITEPVDELALAAEQVNEGNLDVEIEVHEGGEFEGLERAYKEMVEGWRKIMERSIGEE